MEYKTKHTTFKSPYESLIPELTPDQFNQLKKSIKQHGLLKSIDYTTDGKIFTIIDGHHRFKACQELGITPTFNDINPVGKLKVTTQKLQAIELNLARRQLTPLQAIELAQKLVKLQKKKGSNDPKGRTSEKVAKLANVSPATAKRGMAILKDGNPDVIKRTKAGKSTISKSYNKVKRDINRKELLDTPSPGLPGKIKLYNKDFRKYTKAEVKPDSIDLIFTDPPYLEEDLQLYTDLAYFAKKNLKTDGNLICFIGQHATMEIINRITNNGFELYWILALIHTGQNARFYKQKIINTWKPMLWFRQTMQPTNPFVKDSIQSKQEKELHKWQQSQTESDYYIEQLTNPGDLVCDPFLGSGTFGKSANSLYDRHFLGYEIDKTTFKVAKANISDA